VASRPPGDRYFRHPGDVVRLVLAAAALLLLVLFVELATSTSRGVSADLGRAATAVPEEAREVEGRPTVEAVPATFNRQPEFC